VELRTSGGEPVHDRLTYPVRLRHFVTGTVQRLVVLPASTAEEPQQQFWRKLPSVREVNWEVVVRHTRRVRVNVLSRQAIAQLCSRVTIMCLDSVEVAIAITISGRPQKASIERWLHYLIGVVRTVVLIRILTSDGIATQDNELRVLFVQDSVRDSRSVDVLLRAPV